MKKSCQDLEKNLGKIFSRSCKNLARYQAIQDFRMDLEQESCKIRKILASLKSWHGFGTDFLPTCQILKRLGKILQDIFDRGYQFLCMIRTLSCVHCTGELENHQGGFEKLGMNCMHGWPFCYMS